MKGKTKPPRTSYYLIYGRILGKRECYVDLTCKSWLYENGEWVPDEIEEISKADAMRIMEKEDSYGNRC